MPIELPTYRRSGVTRLPLDDFLGAGTPSTSWTGILGYVIGILVILVVILLIVNYTITPIFRLYPGGPGYIPIPGGDSSQVYWKQGSGTPSPFMDASTNVVATSAQWSFSLDIDITNPMHVSPTSSPRVLFHRGPLLSDISNNALTPGIANTIVGILGKYNVAFALLPDTTDLVVSVLNSSLEMENVLLPNVPVQTPFRVGVTLSDTAMEVYLNGLLQRTRTFTSGTTPYNATGMFFPPQAVNAEIAKVANLHLWNSVISPSQMRYATPSLMTVKTSEKSDIPTSTCGTGSDSEQAIDKNLTSWTNTFQTNLGSLSSSIQSNVNETSKNPIS